MGKTIAKIAKKSVFSQSLDNIYILDLAHTQMIDTVNINPETAVQLIVGVGSAVLALLLMLIKIPQSDYSSKLSSSKHAIVVSFFLCSFMMFYTVAQYGSEYIWDWQIFTMLTIYIVVHFSTAIISYSMIALLKTQVHKRQNLFMPGLFVSAIISFLLLESYRSENRNYFWFICVVALTAFLIQSITYIIHFDRAYRQSLSDLETYYDDDEGHKIKWVRFCYVLSMLTNLFILVYLCFYWFFDYKMVVPSLYTLWYLIYMLYLSSNFISFLASHKLVLDAFAHKTLDNISQGGHRTRKTGQAVTSERKFSSLEKSLEEWVSAKKFCEYDKTRDQVAAELKTTKEVLHLYFMTRMGVDFRTWRTGLRIEESKKLLLENPDASINIIAEASGFSDKSNFHRQFVKIVGCSPKEWRESGGKPVRE